MSCAFLIWTRQRTAGIALFNALCGLSEHPAAESEPFDGSVEERQFCLANLLPPRRRDDMLRQICRERWLIKHVYDAVPLEFNLALAGIANTAGYRHIHLGRKSEFARLASLGVAENEVTWIACPATVSTFAALRSGRQQMHALDVPHLVEKSREADRQWRRIDGKVSRCLYVWSEDITARESGKRHRVLSRLLDHLGLPQSGIQRIDRALERSSQDTSQVWGLIPNLAALRASLG